MIIEIYFHLLSCSKISKKIIKLPPISLIYIKLLFINEELPNPIRPNQNSSQ